MARDGPNACIDGTERLYGHIIGRPSISAAVRDDSGRLFFGLPGPGFGSPR